MRQKYPAHIHITVTIKYEYLISYSNSPHQSSSMLKKLEIDPVSETLSDENQSARLDHLYRAMIAEVTGGLSPNTPVMLQMNWLLNLATSPGKMLELTDLARKNIVELSLASILNAYGLAAKNMGVEVRSNTAKPDDRRFNDPEWARAPFNLYKEAFLAVENWCQEATKNIHGISTEDEKAHSFMVHQLLDALSPANFPLTNPEIVKEIEQQGGRNLIKGYLNLLEDISTSGGAEHRKQAHRTSGKYQVGENLATSAGKVVYRNQLIELIQYEPTTKTVHPEPILITPAWIMKYYILDLRPENSLVRYLTNKGFTVFMISWVNPDENYAEFTLDEYRCLGPMAALDEIERITGVKKIHAAGYCLGGTLLSIAAADMARKGDDRLKTLTLLAAQTDFAEAGEIKLFINESNIAFLEDMMKEHGVLEGGQMAGAFKLLRANALIWQRIQQDYLLGTRSSANDMMAWNADTTRMPYKMHSEYLRSLYLENQLSSEKFEVEGHPVSLRDVTVPVFAVGTETDHVAPWQSVFKIHQFCYAPVQFILTKGGHNAGIVSEPGHPRRHYHTHRSKTSDPALTPEDWLDIADYKDGSWWPEWARWLSRKSTKKQATPQMGNALAEAPGTYIFMD